jgi:hypothetical protein
VTSEFVKKKIIRFLHLAKNYSVQVRNLKNGFLIFLTVVERYSKSFMQKNWQKFIENPPGNNEKQCLTFSYWRFFFATYCICKFPTILTHPPTPQFGLEVLLSMACRTESAK